VTTLTGDLGHNAKPVTPAMVTNTTINPVSPNSRDSHVGFCGNLRDSKLGTYVFTPGYAININFQCASSNQTLKPIGYFGCQDAIDDKLKGVRCLRSERNVKVLREGCAVNY
jgi:hypothetical protein